MEDSNILELLYSRSEQAITALDASYGRSAKAVIRNITGSEDDTEECLNDAYLAVWNSVPPQHPEHLQAYLLGIARNVALDRYRFNHARMRSSRNTVALEELEQALPTALTVEDAVGEKELAEAINAFLGALPKKDRVLFVGRYYLGAPLSQLAACAGISNGAVSVRLFRLREQLKRYLKKEDLL